MSQIQKTIRTIIDGAGGAAAIVTASEAVGLKLGIDAIYKWRHNGIPDRYWSVIMPMANVSEADLFAANELARAEKAA